MKIILFFMSFMIFFPVANAQNFAVIGNLCPSGSDGNICPIPFELVYTHRMVFLGRKIQLQGFLLAGVNMEPPPVPGHEIPLLLLFSSVDDANLCQTGFAIKLESYSDEIFRDLMDAGSSYVSITGLFQRNPGGFSPPPTGQYWAEIIVTKKPQRIAGQTEKLQSNCLIPSPPLPYPGPSLHNDLK